MEPNSNLFRQILRQVKDVLPGAIIQFEDLTCEGFNKSTIVGNVEVMIEMGLLVGEIMPPTFETLEEGSDNFLIRKITWKGREFLRNVQNDTI